MTTATAVMRCPQCERVVPSADFDYRQSHCRACRNANQALYDYWIRLGMRVSEHKPHRWWMEWAKDDL